MTSKTKMMMTSVQDILLSRGLYNDVIELIFDYIVGDKYSHKQLYNLVMLHFGDGYISHKLKKKLCVIQKKVLYYPLNTFNSTDYFEGMMDNREPYISKMFYDLSKRYNPIVNRIQGLKDLSMGKTLSFNNLIELHSPCLRRKLTMNIKKIISAIKTDLHLYEISTYTDEVNSLSRIVKNLEKDNILKGNIDSRSIVHNYKDIIKWGGDIDWNTTLSLYYIGNPLQKPNSYWLKIYRNQYHGDRDIQNDYINCMLKIKYDNGKRVVNSCRWSDTVQTEKTYRMTVLSNKKIALYGDKRRVVKIQTFRDYEYIQFTEEREGRTGKREYWTLFKHRTQPIRGKMREMIGSAIMRVVIGSDDTYA
jgi:hypothetical protein